MVLKEIKYKGHTPWYGKYSTKYYVDENTDRQGVELLEFEDGSESETLYYINDKPVTELECKNHIIKLRYEQSEKSI